MGRLAEKTFGVLEGTVGEVYAAVREGIVAVGSMCRGGMMEDSVLAIELTQFSQVYQSLNVRLGC